MSENVCQLQNKVELKMFTTMHLQKYISYQLNVAEGGKLLATSQLDLITVHIQMFLMHLDYL